MRTSGASNLTDRGLVRSVPGAIASTAAPAGAAPPPGAVPTEAVPPTIGAGPATPPVTVPPDGDPGTTGSSAFDHAREYLQTNVRAADTRGGVRGRASRPGPRPGRLGGRRRRGAADRRDATGARLGEQVVHGARGDAARRGRPGRTRRPVSAGTCPGSGLADESAAAPVTVRQLLVQTSGLPAVATIGLTGPRLATTRPTARSPHSVRDLSGGPTRSHHHGRDAPEYSDANYQILGVLVEETVAGSIYAGGTCRPNMLDPLRMNRFRPPRPRRGPSVGIRPAPGPPLLPRAPPRGSTPPPFDGSEHLVRLPGRRACRRPDALPGRPARRRTVRQPTAVLSPGGHSPSSTPVRVAHGPAPAEYAMGWRDDVLSGPGDRVVWHAGATAAPSVNSWCCPTRSWPWRCSPTAKPGPGRPAGRRRVQRGPDPARRRAGGGAGRPDPRPGPRRTARRGGPAARTGGLVAALQTVSATSGSPREAGRDASDPGTCPSPARCCGWPPVWRSPRGRGGSPRAVGRSRAGPGAALRAGRRPRARRRDALRGAARGGSARPRRVRRGGPLPGRQRRCGTRRRRARYRPRTVPVRWGRPVRVVQPERPAAVGAGRGGEGHGAGQRHRQLERHVHGVRVGQPALQRGQAAGLAPHAVRDRARGSRTAGPPAGRCGSGCGRRTPARTP